MPALPTSGKPLLHPVRLLESSMCSHCRGFSLIELVIVVAIISILAALAVPALLRARVAGNEASAIGSLRAIHDGQATFSKTCAQGAFATDLATLAIGPGGSGLAFVSPDLASNGIVKSDYRIALSDGGSAPATGITSCNNQAAIAMGYAGTASPMASWPARRYFGINTTGTIWQGPSALTMTSSGSPAGGTPVQ